MKLFYRMLRVVFQLLANCVHVDFLKFNVTAGKNSYKNSMADKMRLKHHMHNIQQGKWKFFQYLLTNVYFHQWPNSKLFQNLKELIFTI